MEVLQEMQEAAVGTESERLLRICRLHLAIMVPQLLLIDLLEY